MNADETEDSASKWNAELEHVLITNKDDFFYQKYGKIKVYGGGEDGEKRENNPPHFHLEITNNKEIQVVIPVNIDGELKTIKGELNNQIIEDLRKWFEIPFKMDNSKNNYQALKTFWNVLNDGDDNVEKI